MASSRFPSVRQLVLIIHLVDNVLDTLLVVNRRLVVEHALACGEHIVVHILDYSSIDRTFLAMVWRISCFININITSISNMKNEDNHNSNSK